MIKIIIPGEPVAQGRPRFGNGKAYDPAKSKAYKNMVSLSGRAQMGGKEPVDGALAVSICIFRSIPKSFTKAKRAAALSGKLRPTTRPDMSNYIKGIEDALNGIVWKDDSCIVGYCEPFGKWYSDDPRAEVIVSKIG
jgi:Holliday junction resolvase RusA-like endonuclease